jgi:carboxymethylenebutenolidase
MMVWINGRQRGLLSESQFLQRAGRELGDLSLARTLAAQVNHYASNELPQARVTLWETEENPPAPPGVITAGVSYPETEDLPLYGFLARPETGKNRQAGVIVIQEWWGLNRQIKEVAMRLAAEGYVALAPDLYHGVMVTEPDQARKLVMEVDRQAAVREIQAAGAYLLSREDVDKVGVMGFCMGGGLALHAARQPSDFDASVAFYGRPLTNEEARDVRCPVLGLFGADDHGIGLDLVEQMQYGLQQAGIVHQIQVFENAGHAFFNESRASFHPKAASQAWKMTLDWFARHLA